jgi:predicted transcriptional regulator
VAAARTDNTEQARIMLGLLESVEQDGTQSQRRLAAELGIALGLVNAYLRRCVNKGLLKISEAPARRYAYYLTSQGFAEKSRLTIEYLSYSFSFFRQAKVDCADVFETARLRGFSKVVLAGISDLSEIAAICALESGINIVAVVDAQSVLKRFVGVPVASSFETTSETFDAVVVTDLLSAQRTTEDATQRFGAERVLVPALLARRVGHRKKGLPQ